jgi:uncharacterized protein YcbK (DUF882 family)
VCLDACIARAQRAIIAGVAPLRALIRVLSIVTAFAVTTAAHAERQHTVAEGQSLISIARGYHVSVDSLAAANERAAQKPIRVGEVLSVPEQGTVYLGAGQSLWTIARAHGCTVEALTRANGIDPHTPVRPGMRLRLPGAKATKGGLATATKSASAPSNAGQSSVRSGSVKLYRIATQERLQLALTDTKGRVRPQAATRIARFLRPRNSTKQKRPEPRLLSLLAQVADHYRGRTIQVVSGYRLPGGSTSGESRHTRGAAIDMRVDGVSARALCDYLRHFTNVGVGYYPNSNFVHFDVREKNAYWIDLSSPGRRASYLDREQRDHFDGKNKDEGLVDLGRSIEAALEQGSHGEPAASDPKAADE